MVGLSVVVIIIIMKVIDNNSVPFPAELGILCSGLLNIIIN